MRTEASSQKKNAARTGRLARWGGVAGVGVVGLLALLAPMASAASIYTAPYASTYVVQQQSIHTQGLGAQVVVTTPTVFSAISGHVYGVAHLKAAAVPNQPSVAFYATTVGLKGLPFTASSSGVFQVQTGWIVGFTTTLSTHFAPGGVAAGAWASMNVRLTTYLVDQSTGAVMPGSTNSVLVWTQAVSHGILTTTFGPELFVLGPAPTMLVAGHTYGIVTLIDVNALASMAPIAPAGSVATVSMNIGAPLTALLWVRGA